MSDEGAYGKIELIFRTYTGSIDGAAKKAIQLAHEAYIPVNLYFNELLIPVTRTSTVEGVCREYAEKHEARQVTHS